MEKPFLSLVSGYWKASAAVILFFLGACATSPDGPTADVPGPAAPSEPVFVLADILGAAPDVLEAKLGPPALTRREGDGEFQRYRLGTCMLIVILYPDDGGGSRVAHVDAAALSSEDDKPDLEVCLAAG